MNSRLTNAIAARRFALLGAIGAVSLTVLGTTGDARAQIAGTTTRPLPNVLLLVDSSGSMERMADNSMPSANVGGTNICSPGVASNPNRWGMLIQALTGNLQPYFSCDAIPRNSSSFKNEFRIGGTGPANLPYDADYFLPYHRPLTGDTPASACAFAPYTLPGASPGSGLGPAGLGTITAPYSDSSSFPPDAFKAFKENYLRGQYGAGVNGSPLLVSASNTCNFEQANDGQLDAARDYIRFGLMMFDNDPSNQLGVALSPQPNGGNVLTASPFAGQWSYVKSSGNPDPLGFGRPVGCATTTPFEVGARHWAAPPWEGRMVKFPDPDGTLYDIARTNDEIQKVLVGTRPYGATPIDGMMEDARDYLWYNDYGPLGSQAGYHDNYVASSCREQYIVLLTDGAPNLDLRPACEPGTPTGLCPYPNKAAQVADLMANAVSANQKVKTYVIGFSVNGAGSLTIPNDGFPPAYNALTVPPSNNCKAFFNGVTTNGTNLTAMHSLCSGPSAPQAGSTADACCKLSEIAYYGSGPAHDTPPFFAETQADLVLSFGRVLGGISKAATTRTLPGYSPAVSVSGQGLTADFVASFIPNAQKVWSGEIDRTRSICIGAVPTPQTPQTVLAGDSYAANTAAQAAAGKRLFVSVKGTPGSAVAPFSGVAIDSARTIRPWATAPADGIVVANSGGAQVVGTDMGLAATPDWPAALQIDDNTCKRSRDVSGLTIPKLLAGQCTNVVWGFAAATAAPLSYNGYTKFNVRCGGTASATSGFCSVSGAGCTLNGAPCSGLPGGKPGEVCVPECSALGAIYRSSPTLVGPPNDLLRDDAYRAFSDQRKSRRPAMFVASTDGVLHAFKALATTNPTFDNVAAEYELWAFVPPAVLPRLSTNYPTGQQILLDGTPAVKDIVWDRLLRTEAPLYHTTLVSGMGAGGGGYYGLSVTDSDCQGSSSTTIGTAPNGCLPAGSISTASSLANLASAATKGPQFLWQLTDVESFGPTDWAKPLRTSRDGKDFVALFGKESGNAAIATLVVNPDGAGIRQVGVAILPGGIDGPPVKGQYCNRAINGGAAAAFAPTTYDASDNVAPFGPRSMVRQWAGSTPAECATAPVPGRNVTIVRADTGEILRVFGRPTQDIPRRLEGVRTNAPFDSPIIGTPAVYPNQIGVPAQKIFVGDADGTLWRIDVSDPLPANWKVQLFQDLVSANLPAAPGAAQSQPIQIPPVLTQDPFGGLIISAATGDQENIVASTTERNYLMSIQEQRGLSPTTPGRALVRWYQPFTNAARVTGPMTVFDRTLYFATYQPVVPAAGACTNGGGALLWGMDYFNPQGGSVSAASGGVARWCPINRVDPVSGACLDPLVQNENPATFYPSLVGAIIPGVTIRASQSCASFSGPASDPLITGMSATSFSLFFGATSAGAGGSATGTPQAARPTTPLTRPLPRTAANIDSWALVVD